MDKNNYKTMFYFLNKKLSIDDFLKLEQIAAIEIEKMEYKMSLCYMIDDTKLFTSLN